MNLWYNQRMDDKTLPAALLRDLLEYDPETGALKWRKRPPGMFVAGDRSDAHKANNWNARWAGKPAMTSANNGGYLRGPCMGIYVQAHRAIWAIVTGHWPEGQIDHVNGVRDDNRWCNLRVVDHKENAKNAKRRATNKSGFNGVYWHADRHKWRAQISADGRKVCLGYYDDFDEAVRAREKADLKYGFTASHGRR